MRKILYFLFSILAWGVGYNAAQAQLGVTAGTVGQDVINALQGTGVVITNVQINCPNNAWGTYTLGADAEITPNQLAGFSSTGLIITSGDIGVAVGPNTSSSAGSSNGGGGSALLGGSTFDRCHITFDFQSLCQNQINFVYSFGSEEYLEYVGGGFNDKFGFFVCGGAFGGCPPNAGQNVACVPPTATPPACATGVTIDNVNTGSNPAFYFDNQNLSGVTTQYDGFTRNLQVIMNVVPLTTYTITLAIADFGDSALDSGAFISPFNTPPLLNTIQTIGLPSPLCVGGGFNTQFAPQCPFDFYWVQLSDAAGNFPAVPPPGAVVPGDPRPAVGTNGNVGNQVPSNSAAPVPTVIPAGTPPGTCYLVRVIGYLAPAIVGSTYNVITGTSNPSCVVVQPDIVADAGPDQNICVSNATLDGNFFYGPNPGLDLSPYGPFLPSWSFVSGPTTPTLSGSDPVNVTGMSVSGTYTFRYFVDGPCNDPFDEMQVVVTLPVATVPALGPFCSNDATAIPLNGIGETPSGGTYAGTGVSGAVGAQVFTPSTASIGANVITYSGAVAGCNYSTNISINVVSTPNPTINLTTNPVPCGGVADLTVGGAPAGSQYTITRTGPGGFSAGPSTGTSYTDPSPVSGATYTVQYVTAAAPGCVSNTAQTTVTVTGPPAAPTPPAAQTLTCGQTLSMTATGVGPFNWTGPNGFTATGATVTRANVDATMAGTYSVTQGSGACTSVPATVQVTINPLAAPTVPGPQVITCGGTLTLTATGVGPFNWTFPDGPTFAGSTIVRSNVVPSMAGAYQVTQGTGGCQSAAATVVVTINPFPAPTVASNSPVVCGNDIMLTATGVTTNFDWTGPNAFVATGANVTRTNADVTMAGNYFVTQGTGACTSTPASVAVVVNPLAPPTVASNGPVSCGNPLNLTATGVGPFDWTGPNAFTATGALVSISPTDPTMSGIYSVTQGVGGCQSTAAQISVTVNAVGGAAPSVSNNGPICSGLTLLLTGPSVPAGFTYSWQGPNGFTSNQQNPSIAGVTVAASGVYSLIITTADGCVTPPGTTTVTVNQTPTATATNNGPLTCGDDLQLFSTSVAGATFAWTGPNGFNSSTQNPLLPLASTTLAGTYTVVATSPQGCPSAAVSTTVLIAQLPTPTASNNGPVCENQALQFNATTAIANVAFAWTGPNGFASSDQNPIIPNPTTLNSGQYIVTISKAGCVATASTFATVNPLPVLTVSSNGPICEGQTAQLFSSTSIPITAYNWTGPAGFNSVVQSPIIPNVTTANGGTYTLITTTATGCNSVPVFVNLIVNPNPLNLAASNDGPYCENLPGQSTIQLTATNTLPPGATYQWTGPNGFSSNQQNPVILNASAANSGVYTVVATLPGTGCVSAPASTTVTVSPPPAQPVTGNNGPICAGDILNLTAVPDPDPNAQYVWSGVNGFVSTAQNPTLLVTGTENAGSYFLIIYVNNCPSEVTETDAIVHPVPDAPIATANTPCEGGTIDLNAGPQIAGALYQWVGPASFTANQISPSIPNVTTNNSGTYTVIVTNPQGCTSSPGTVDVVVNSPTVPPVSGNNGPLCEGQDLMLTVQTVAGATYNWTGPNGFVSNNQNPVIPNVTTANAGTYFVSVSTQNCTSALGSTTVVVRTNPMQPSAGTNGPLCIGEVLNLTASPIPGATYNWTGPNGFTSNSQNPVILSVDTQHAGTYSVTANVNGCNSLQQTTPLIVFANPATPTPGNSGPYCSGQTITLTAPVVGGATYSWIGPNGFGASIPNPVIPNVTPADAGDYSLTVTVNGCPSVPGVTTVVVNTNPAPPVASNAGPVCVGGNLSLNAVGPVGATYTWVGPNGFSSNMANPMIPSVTSSAAGDYSVTTTLNGCTSSMATTNVIVNPGIAPVPVANNGPLCEGQDLFLTADFVNNAVYNWSGPNGFLNNNQNPVIFAATQAESGDYSLTITVNGCVSPVTVTNVAVRANPAAPLSGNNGPLCVGATLQLTAETIFGATYTWSGPNGFFSMLQNPTIAAVPTTATGQYSVQVTVAGCMSLPGTTDVIVNAVPPMVAVGNNGPVCEGATINLTATTIPGASYTWSGPSSYTSNTQNPVILNSTTANEGEYSLTVTMTGCPSMVSTTTVVVNTAPISPNPTNNGPLCEGQNLMLSVPTIPGATYMWTGPNGFSSMMQVPTPILNVTTSNAGTYFVTAMMDGCQSVQASIVVVVNPVPPTPLATNNAPFCEGGILQLTAGTIPGATFMWTGPLGYSSVTQNPVILNATTLQNGNYSLTATLNGCMSAETTTNVVIFPIPNPPGVANNGPLCEGAQLQLTAANVAGATYMWTGPNAFSSNLQNPIINNVTTNNAGNYNVTVMVNGCMSNIATTQVVVFQNPVAPFVGSNSPLCVGDNLNLTATNIPFATYTWTGPNGFSAMMQNPTIPTVGVNATGQYSLNMTLNGCPAPQATVNVVVNPIPAAPMIGNNGPKCEGQALNLTAANVTGGTFTWSGPSAFVSALQNPTIAAASVNNMGTYSAIVTVNGCPSNVSTTDVVIYPIPAAPVAGNDSPICAGSTLNLTTAMMAGASYMWTGPNNFTSTMATPSIPMAGVNASGDYSVTVTMNGCTSPMSTTTVVVNAIPAAPMPMNNTPICEGSNLMLTANTIAGASYMWTGPDNFMSLDQNPIIAGATMLNDGVYTVTATVNGCTSMPAFTEAFIEPTPAMPGVFTNAPICQGNMLMLTATSVDPNVTYTWSGPGGYFANISNPSILNATIFNSGVYSVTVSENGCTSAPMTILAEVKGIPAGPAADSNGPVCEGDDLELYGLTAPGATYMWSGPNGYSSPDQNPVISNVGPLNAGLYTLMVWVNGCGAQTSGTVQVVVNPTPMAPIATNNSPVCAGQTVNLVASFMPNATYEWTGPNFYNSPLQNPQISNVGTLQAGVYSVTASVAGCTSEPAITTVTVTPSNVTLNPTSNSPICVGQNLMLTVNAVPGASYQWLGPNGFTSALQNPMIPNVTSMANGTYSVKVTIAGCQSNMFMTNVVVNAVPLLTPPGANTPICVGQNLQFTAGNIPGATYMWTGPNGFTSAVQNPNINNVMQTASGVYTVTATLSGCPSQQRTISVTVNPSPANPAASNNGPVCVNGMIQLDAMPIPGATYMWTGPSGFTSNAQSPQIMNATMMNGGIYSVTAMVAGCTSPVSTTNVIVQGPPSAPVAGNNGPLCTGSTLQFTATSVPGATYIWTGPNGFVSNFQNPAIINASVLHTGTYTVSAMIGGCTSPVGVTTVVVGNTLAQTTIGSNSPICSGQTLTLTANTASLPGATYMWTGPNGFNSTFGNPPAILNATSVNAGTYTLTTTLGQCTSQATLNVVVNAIPATPTASNNGPVCNGGALNLFASAVPGATYSWLGPNGFSSASQNPATILNAGTQHAGTYSVMTMQNGCMSAAMAMTTVMITPNPAMPSIMSNSPICVGGTLNLSTAVVPGATYMWMGPNNFTSNNQNPTIANAQATASGTYSLMVSVNGCTSMQATMMVMVNAAPVTPTAVSNSPVCEGGMLMLTAGLVPGATYMWTGPNGFTSNSPGPMVPNAMLAASGTYNVTAMVGGCTSTASFTTVVVNPTPAQPLASSNTPICTGSNLQLTATPTSGAMYMWMGPNGYTSAMQNPTITQATPMNSGTYSVSLTLNGCTSPMSTTTVVVSDKPTVQLQSASQVAFCEGGSVDINVLLTGKGPWTLNYLMNGVSTNVTLGSPNSNSPATFSLMMTPTMTTTYTLNGITDASGCINSALGSVTAVVHPNPTVMFVNTTASICMGETVAMPLTLTGKGPWEIYYKKNGITQAPWIVGSGMSPSPFNTTAMDMPMENTTYELNSVEDAYGCTSTAMGTFSVEVKPKPTLMLMAQNQTICMGATAMFNVQLTGVGPWTVNYMANATPKTVVLGTAMDMSPTTFMVTVSPSMTTTYTMTNVVSANGCMDMASGSFTVTVNAKPTAMFTSMNQSVCEGQTATLSVQVTGKGPWVVNYTKNGAPQVWNIGDANSTNPFVFTKTWIPTQSEQYVLVDVMDANGCSQAAMGSVIIDVKSTPSITLNSSNQQICVGQTAQMDLTLTGQGPWTINYSMNNVAQAPLILGNAGTPSPFMANLPITPMTTTTFTLMGVTSANGCSAMNVTGTFVVTVKPQPAASFTPGNTILCGGQATDLRFTLSGKGPWTVNWTENNTPMSATFGTALSTSPAIFIMPITPTMTTTYTLVSVMDANCMAPALGSTIISVLPAPTVAVTASNTTVCSGQTTTLSYTFTGQGPWTVTQAVNGVTQAMAFGNANSGSPATFTMTITPSATQTYQLISVISGNECQASATGSVTINVSAAPNATISGNTTTCGAGSAVVNLAISGVAANQSWILTYMEDATTKTILGVGTGTTALTFNNILATKVITLVSIKNATGNACERMLTGTATITINMPPQICGATLTQPQAPGATGSISVGATGGAGGYTYSIDGINFSNTTGLFTGLSPAVYRVWVRDQSGCMGSTNNIKLIAFTQPTVFQRSYIAPLEDRGNSIEQTADGGYIVSGFTRSFGAGNEEAFLMKTTSEGVQSWVRTYGGVNNDRANHAVQTTDGGYIFAGNTSSFGAGQGDAYVVKTDATGNVQWRKTIGRNGDDQGRWVEQVMGGYLVAGVTRATTGSNTSREYYLTKFDNAGNVLWSKTYGNPNLTDEGMSITSTCDGGALFVGSTPSGLGGADVYAVKVNDKGDQDWMRIYGTNSDDQAFAVRSTLDGNYVIGATNTVGNQTDAAMMKIDNGGALIWANRYGTTSSEEGHKLVESADGGYTIAGFRSTPTGARTAYLVKADVDGNMVWNSSFTGGANIAQFEAVAASRDGGYAAIGTVAETNGGFNGYFVKTDGMGMTYGCKQTTVNGVRNSLAVAVVTPTAPFAQTNISNIVTNPAHAISAPLFTNSVICGPAPTAALQLTNGGQICLGQASVIPVTLTGLAPWTLTYNINGGNPMSVSGIMSSPYNLTVVPTTTGPQFVQLLSVSDFFGGASNAVTGSFTVDVTPNSNATATLSGVPGTLCQGQTALATVTLTGQAPWSVTYNENGGAPITVNNITASPATIVLTATGVGSRTFTLTQVTDGNGCTGTLATGSVVLNTNAFTTPTAMLSGPTKTVCLSETATYSVNLTGQSPWTITYTENGGTPMTVSGITNSPYTLTVTPMGLGTRVFTLASVLDANACTAGSVSGSVTANVQATSTATATISGSSNSLCIGQTAVFTVNFTGAAPWTLKILENGSNLTTVTNIMTNPYSLTVTPTGSGARTFTISDVGSGSCLGGQGSGSAIASVIEAAGGTITGNAPEICQGQQALFTLNLTGVAPWTVTYTENGANPVTVSNIFSTPFVLAVTPTGTGVRTFTLTSVNNVQPCSGGSAGGTATVNVLPGVGATATFSSASASTCLNQATTLSVNLTGTAPWTIQISENGGTPQTFSNIQTSPFTFVVTPTTSGARTFTITSVTQPNACGTGQGGSMTLNVVAPPTLTVLSNSSACGGATVVLQASGGSGSGYTFSSDGVNFSNTTGIFTGLTAGNYTFSVKDGAGCIGSLPVTVTANGGSPIILSVGSPTTTSLTVTWAALSGVSSYTVQFRVQGSNAAFSQITGITGTSTTVSGLLAGTTYEFRVVAVCTSGTTSTPSQTSTGTTTASSGCTTPTTFTFTPTNPTSGIFAWTPTSGAVCYIVSYGPLSSNPSLWPQFLVPHPGSSLTVNDLLPNTQYGYQIRTNCSLCSVRSGIRSNPSATFTFTTAASREAQIASESVVQEFRVYPNPNRGLFSVLFDAQESGTVELSVLDATGRAVYNRTVVTQNGKNELPIDLAQQAAGVYLLHFKQGQNLRTVKVIVN